MRRFNLRGVTIIEALIAVMMLTIVFLAAVGAIPMAFRNMQQGSGHAQAVAVGQQYLDAIRQSIQADPALATPAPPTIAVDTGESVLGSGTANAGSGNFTMVPNCTLLAGANSHAYDCTVTVTWQMLHVPKMYTLETIVAQQ
jgi:Tfp pilus assembly protein PilV